MEKEKVVIDLPTKMVVLTINPFDADIDTDSVCQIQHHNIIGELLTSSVQLNRIGNLLAEVEQLEREKRLDLQIFEAERVEKIQKGLVKIGEKEVKAGISDKKLEYILVMSPEWQIRRKKVIDAAKMKSIVSHLYWALKSKDDKLNKITEKLQPEEFEKEIVEGVINGIKIKVSEKAAK